ncbi:MAG: hypothetical protein B6242_00320 [Anaerolineaceae bacterium 4572_78]|nr:MAG: hypothetical protein B6242_00320 [Anaerolineaceae bacterium 4572_78]
MIDWLDLRPILDGISWVVVGGVATRAYMPERATQDLDILLHISDKDEVLKRLTEADYKVVSSLSIHGFSLRSPNGIMLDVLMGDYNWLSEAMVNLKEDMAGYPVLDLPYLVLMKLESSRTQDLADISRMLGLATELMRDRVRHVISHYAPQDVEDVESLIYLGQLEIAATKSENISRNKIPTSPF